MLTSAKVSASVKPACATPVLSWSVSLFTGNCKDREKKIKRGGGRVGGRGWAGKIVAEYECEHTWCAMQLVRGMVLFTLLKP